MRYLVNRRKKLACQSYRDLKKFVANCRLVIIFSSTWVIGFWSPCAICFLRTLIQQPCDPKNSSCHIAAKAISDVEEGGEGKGRQQELRTGTSTFLRTQQFLPQISCANVANIHAKKSRQQDHEHQSYWLMVLILDNLELWGWDVRETEGNLIPWLYLSCSGKTNTLIMQ